MKSKICITTTRLSFLMTFLFSVFMMHNSFAQGSGTVSGIVNSASDGMGVPGATVLVEGTKISTVTDFDGKFTINATTGNVLKISFMGFKTQNVTVGAQKNITVTLQEEASELKEIVVIGYGTQKKKVSTAATSVVSGESLQQVNSIDVTNALQGQTSGVSISSTSGQPGAGMVVNIRGAGTVGNASPLYIVDGVMVDNGIDYLDPSSIERVDVLKDASAAAIYGARAANGVILVTTKKGKEGTMNVALNSYTGFQQVAKRLDLLNSNEYAVISNEARVNSGLTPLYDMNQIANLPNTNWQESLFNDGAIKQNHSLTLTGGSEKTTYATGLSYYGQEGLIGGVASQSDYQRITFNVNTTTELLKDRLKIGENFSFANVYSKGIADNGIYDNSIRSFFNAPPLDAVYDANGNFAHSNVSNDIANPLAVMYYNNFNETKNNRYVGNIFLEANIIENLTFRTSYGVDMSDRNYRAYVPVYDLSTNTKNARSSVTQSANKDIGWIFENTLNYKVSIKDLHNFDVLIGTSAKKTQYDYQSASGKDVDTDGFGNAYLSNAKDQLSNTISGGRNDYALQSYFGRLLYDFDNKYLFTATIRRDGSSNISPKHRYGYFPSFSAGWNVDRERFWPTDAVVKSLKLRASWGQNGNDQIEAFSYMSTISTYDKSYHFGTGANEVLTPGASPDALSNLDIKWETSEQTDLGFDMTLFSNLTLSFDYYDKKTKDWLVQASISEIAGAEAPFINGGDVTNKGFEIGLGYRTSIGEDWKIALNGNFSMNKNEVTRIANSEGVIHGDPNLLFQGIDELNRVEVGQPIGYFYGLKTDGIFQNAAEVAAGKQPNAQPGDVRFVDFNGDGKIDQNDKTKIGDPNADFNYGFSIDVNYKAFDFSIYTYGVGGNQNVFGIRDYSRGYNNYTTAILDRWTTEGSSNKIPRVTSSTDANGNYTKFSDLYIQDADFFRIKSATIGCDLTKLSDKFNVFSKFRLYVGANNLFTFTKYKGLDPEIGFGNENQKWARGIDVGYYPQPRTYMLGLNVNF